jgi:hypothetical protein
MVKVRSVPTGRIRQGDVLSDVECVERVVEREGTISVSKIVFPLAIVLAQDCDLEQEHRSRKRKKLSPDNLRQHDQWLLSVLVAPLYNVEHVFRGEHLSELGIQMASINRGKTEGDYLRQNVRPRYHYVEFPEEVPIVPSVIDFKHYFSVNGQYLNEHRRAKYVCTVGELFREQICARFASFLARIGLPTVGQKSTRRRNGPPAPAASGSARGAL